QKSIGDMENLELATTARSVGRNEDVLRPRKDGLHRDFLRSNVRYRDMLGGMPIIQDIRLHRQAFEKGFWRRLQESEILPTATRHRCGEENCRHEHIPTFAPSMFVTQL